MSTISVSTTNNTAYKVTADTTGSALGSFDSAISAGYLQLLFTPVNASTTVKLSTRLIPV